MVCFIIVFLEAVLADTNEQPPEASKFKNLELLQLCLAGEKKGKQ